MPEWNLVRIKFANRIGLVIVMVLTLSIMQPGCSKLRQSTLKQGLMGSKRSPSWAKTQPESAHEFVRQTSAAPDVSPRRDEARITGIKDGIARDADVKLTASQPELSPANRETKSSVDNLFCEHSAECDCHKPKETPRLPFAEPVDPPVIGKAPPANTNQAPPREIVYQPLKPILFDSGTREAQVTEVKATEEQAAEEQGTSRRRNQDWSHEKPVAVEKTELGVEAALNEFDATTRRVIEEREIAEANETPSVQPTQLTMQASTGDRQMTLQPVCEFCQQSGCAGKCASQSRRKTNQQMLPIVDTEPIVIVATNSEESSPPEGNRAIVITSEPLAPAVASNSEPDDLSDSPATDEFAESLDDLADEECLAMFGPKDMDRTVCSECESGNCPTSGCAELLTQRENDFNPAVPSTFSAPSHDSGSLPPAENQASQIAVEMRPAADNDFQPASHAVPEDNGFKSEPSAWSPPTTQPTTDQPDAFDSSSEVEESNAPSDFRPKQYGKTVELPLLNTDVQVPDAAKQPSRIASPYTGPKVRFEVIDNTIPWDVQLDETIKSVQSQLVNEEEPTKRNGLEVNLRLLEVLKRQMAGVEDQKASLSDEENEYWQHQLDAITLMLRTSEEEDSDLTRHQSAINTLDHLRKAVERLETIADLKVAQGAFCTEVSGFGQFKEFPSTTFSAGQPLLIYCEIENFSSTEHQVNAGAEVRTRLRGSYVIYDEQGRVVQQDEYPDVEDVARKRRRDFYMHFPLQLTNLAPGNYRLELLVEDLTGNKTGAIEPGLQFTVK